MISSKKKKHDELTLRNHHQCFVGSAPLSEVHHIVKGKENVDGSNNHKKKFGKFKNGKHNDKRKNRAKGQGKGKCKALKCHKCGGPNHFGKKMPNPQHLVELY
jgi:hypothetical protein